ncbi:MAG TPA: PLDc N-terminal domain-containing protein [Candidatus Limnocylindria bacterium]|nr:PLDc N-terminal domain-containing protein [Candidatus Limnocylindria bacterium]
MALLQESATRLFSFYAGVFPPVLYATWVILGLWDLTQRTDLTERQRLGWGAAILVVPLAGPLTYLLLSEGKLSWSMRLLVTGGGAAVYLAITGLRLIIP